MSPLVAVVFIVQLAACLGTYSRRRPVFHPRRVFIPSDDSNDSDDLVKSIGRPFVSPLVPMMPPSFPMSPPMSSKSWMPFFQRGITSFGSGAGLSGRGISMRGHPLHNIIGGSRAMIGLRRYNINGRPTGVNPLKYFNKMATPVTGGNVPFKFRGKYNNDIDTGYRGTPNMRFRFHDGDEDSMEKESTDFPGFRGKVDSDDNKFAYWMGTSTLGSPGPQPQPIIARDISNKEFKTLDQTFDHRFKNRASFGMPSHSQNMPSQQPQFHPSFIQSGLGSLQPQLPFPNPHSFPLGNMRQGSHPSPLNPNTFDVFGERINAKIEGDTLNNKITFNTAGSAGHKMGSFAGNTDERFAAHASGSFAGHTSGHLDSHTILPNDMGDTRGNMLTGVFQSQDFANSNPNMHTTAGVAGSSDVRGFDPFHQKSMSNEKHWSPLLSSRSSSLQSSVREPRLIGQRETRIDIKKVDDDSRERISYVKPRSSSGFRSIPHATSVFHEMQIAHDIPNVKDIGNKNTSAEKHDRPSNNGHFQSGPIDGLQLLGNNNWQDHINERANAAAGGFSSFSEQTLHDLHVLPTNPFSGDARNTAGSLDFTQSNDQSLSNHDGTSKGKVSGNTNQVLNTDFGMVHHNGFSNFNDHSSTNTGAIGSHSFPADSRHSKNNGFPFVHDRSSPVVDLTMSNQSPADNLMTNDDFINIFDLFPDQTEDTPHERLGIDPRTFETLQPRTMQEKIETGSDEAPEHPPPIFPAQVSAAPGSPEPSAGDARADIGASIVHDSSHQAVAEEALLADIGKIIALKRKEENIEKAFGS